MPRRHYVIHEPANFYNLVKRKKLPVLFYAHGKQVRSFSSIFFFPLSSHPSQGNAWDSVRFLQLLFFFFLFCFSQLLILPQAIDETDWRRISAEEGFMVMYSCALLSTLLLSSHRVRFGQAQGELFPHPFALYGDYQLSTWFYSFSFSA